MQDKDRIIALIEESIDDEFLTKSEKRNIKSLLMASNPDKSLQDVLRSEFFKIAFEKINSENYQRVLNWVELMNKVIISAVPVKNIKEDVYFSPGQDCLNAILAQIRKTKKVMRICLFTISDNRITEEIIRKHQQGIHVQIITDNDKLFDKGSDVKELFSKGIPVKIDNTDKHMHHKFALFDKNITLTGSYNWTRSAEKYNNENIIVSDSQNLHHRFEKEFIKLWDRLDFYQ